jgi:hypothetical protein
MRQQVVVAFRFTEFGFEADHHRTCIYWGGQGSHPAGCARIHFGCIPQSRTALKKMPPLTEGGVFFD